MVSGSLSTEGCGSRRRNSVRTFVYISAILFWNLCHRSSSLYLRIKFLKTRVAAQGLEIIVGFKLFGIPITGINQFLKNSECDIAFSLIVQNNRQVIQRVESVRMGRTQNAPLNIQSFAEHQN
jgi:hypothetical protein